MTHFKHTDFLYSVPQQEEKGERAVMQERVACTEGGGLCWKSIKSGSRVPPQGA